MINVGIDVGSKELVLVSRDSGNSGRAKTFANTVQGHQTIGKLLSCRGAVRVCLEATGSYHLDLAVALSEQPDVEVMVVNPKAAKRFGEARMTRTKTDKVDAGVLAEFAERMEFIAWRKPSDEVLALRACSRRLAALTDQKTQAKNQLHAMAASATTPLFVLDDARLSIQQMEAQITNLRDKTLELIAADSMLSETLELLVTVTGIAETSAMSLMGEILVLPPDMSARQWVAMAGLDPRHFTSGTSVNKPARLSKAGNRYLRKPLYMPALNASYRNPYVKAYYEHLINDNGLKKIQAICAVMRKLLHAIHGMLKHRKPFDASRFYNLEAHAD